MQTLKPAALLSLLLLPACAAPAAPPASAPAEAPSASAAAGGALGQAAATITPEDLRAHIAYLASDELRGRDTPSPGLDSAAVYLAREFHEMGLRPAGDSGSFIQRWPYQAARIDASASSLRLGRAGSAPLVFGRDFFVVPGPRGEATGPLLVAGPAADAQPSAHLRGAVPLYSLPGATPQEWGEIPARAVLAGVQTGAAAVGLVLDPEVSEEAVGEIAQAAAAQQAPLPIVFVRREPALTRLRAVGADLRALDAPAGSSTVEPKAVAGATAELKVPRSVAESRAPNVVAVLPGSDPALRDEYVVLSAHFDHVGVGRPDARGDSVFNGADDNASGTAALLEVAQALAALPTPPARSVLFLAVSGEEKGLLGSAYFADNPTVPVGQIVANVNADMIGRNHPDSLVAIGLDYSSLGPLTHQIATAHPELALTVVPDPWPEEQLFFRSDHFNFARKQIPAIFFTTGLHQDYHKPSDEAAKIDAAKETRVARLIFYLTNAIAAAPTAPEWTPEGRAAVQMAPGG